MGRCTAGALLCGAAACFFAMTSDLFPDDEYPFGHGIRRTFGDDTAQYTTVQPGGIDRIWDPATDSYRFGRYRAPPKDASLHATTPFQTYAQHKEWHWSAFTTGTLFVGVATTQFGYASHALLYVYDVETGLTDHVQLEVLIAGRTLGTSYIAGDGSKPSTPLDGCSTWTFGGTVTQCARGDEMTVHGSATLRSGTQLNLNLTLGVANDDSLSFVYPIGRRRAAAVSKFGGVEGTAQVAINGKTTHADVLGLVDWTRSLAARFTRWYWTSLTFRDAATSTRVGMHLSSGVYEDHVGNGMENCIFINGTLTPIDAPVRFTGPSHTGASATSVWAVTVEDATARVSITFEFTPVSSIHGEFHLLVLDGDLHHMWGTVKGRVLAGGREYHMDRVPAVMEDHYALW